MSVPAKSIATPTRTRVLFEHDDLQSVACEMDRSRDPTDPGANDNNRFRFHGFLHICECTDWKILCFPLELNIDERVRNVIRYFVLKLLRSLYSGRNTYAS